MNFRIPEATSQEQSVIKDEKWITFVNFNSHSCVRKSFDVVWFVNNCFEKHLNSSIIIVIIIS